MVSVAFTVPRDNRSMYRRFAEDGATEGADISAAIGEFPDGRAWRGRVTLRPVNSSSNALAVISRCPRLVHGRSQRHQEAWSAVVREGLADARRKRRAGCFLSS